MKILLLTPTPPNKKSSGGIMLSDLCGLVKKDQIYCFSASDPHLKKEEITKSPAIKKHKSVMRPIESPYHFPNWFFDRQLSWMIEKYKDLFGQRKVIKSAIRFGKENKVDAVWAVLQGKTMINAALPVSRALKVPFLVQLWDDPSWILKDTGIGGKAKSKILRKFDKTVKSSMVCACASPIMAERFQKKYRVKTTTFLGSLDRRAARAAAGKLNSDQVLKIGFAGQLYASREFAALVSAFRAKRWRIGRRSVEIYLLGKVDEDLAAEKNILVVGYKTQKETIKFLSKMDILYCPYWFDRVHKIVAETSFPSKLTTYLAAGRPVLFHGPRYASPAKFIEQNECGATCYSLKDEAIVKCIKSTIEPKNYARLTRAGTLAFQKHLTYKSLKRELDEFLDEAKKMRCQYTNEY